MKRILLLSAYDADSHRRWRNGLVKSLPEFEWTVLTLPPRYFSWRIRGNSLSWAFGQRRVLEQAYDLVIATSMVDLSSLRGMVPKLANTPTLVYFHENQFAYPASADGDRHLEPLMVNLYAALCADKILFNSDYNRHTFLNGVNRLLAQFPDAVPDGIVDHLQQHAALLPVPLEETLFAAPHKVKKQNESDPITIVWNHRWEYDKGPDRLLACIQSLLATLNLRFHIVGRQFRQQPAAFETIHARLEERGWLGQWGYVEDGKQYRALLAESNLVLSTALHDFQGLAVLEAVALGCVPVVPNRLAYPELFGTDYCHASHEDDQALEAKAAAERIQIIIERSTQGNDPPDVSRFSWEVLGTEYRNVITAVV